MHYPTWNNTRTKRIGYARRRPEETALYRLIYHYRDDLVINWESLFQHHYGALRPEVLDAFDRYLNCGILAHGCARAHCPDCNHSILIAFSCKRRGLCPSCDTKRALLFAEHLHNEVLLPHPHRHLVFSIPKRLRIYFRYDRSLNSPLYHSAWQALSEVIATQHPHANPGAVMALHTAGDLLNFHPHLHVLALDGAVADDGAFLSALHLDPEALELLFAQKLISALQAAELLSDDAVANMSSWQHSGFHVYVGETITSDDSDTRLYTAQYLKKPVLALNRIEIINNPLAPTVRYLSPYKNGTHRDFSPLEFLAQLQVHIPDIWEQTTRYYGAYSCRSRGEQKKSGVVPSGDSDKELLFVELPDDDTPPASATWAAMIKRIYEVDPLKCPKRSGQMKIVAFLHSQREIKKICDNLGLSQWRAPPHFNTTPDEPQLVQIFTA